MFNNKKSIENRKYLERIEEDIKKLPEELKQYKDWIIAGKLSAKALEYGKNLIKPNTKIKDILNAVDDFIFSFGLLPAFPSQISINYYAAHYCSSIDDEATIKEEDVVKLDVGVCYNGALGDNALTIDLSGKHQKLLDASKEALEEAIKILKPNITLSEIGRIIEEKIKSKGYKPIRNLSGHSLDYYRVHAGISIPNYNTNSKKSIEKGTVIAIEPFATDGFGLVFEHGKANVFMQISNKNIRHPLARKVLQEIRKYKGLPFARRWLEKKFRKEIVSLSLELLLKENIITDFPPLIEKAKGLVSQFEYTIIILDKPYVTTRI